MTFKFSARTPSNDFSDFHAQQSIDLSRARIDAYQSKHEFQSNEDRSPLAESRLEFLLATARAELSGKFTSADFCGLLNCYTGEMLEPAAADGMADTVLEFNPEATELAQKLESLTRLQKVGLADLLEQMYYRDLSLVAPLLS